MSKAAAELTAAFKAMQLHQRPHVADFPTDVPFQETCRIQVGGKPDLYGCAFNQYADSDDHQFVAIAGADGLNVYSIPLDVNRIKHVWGCSFEKISPAKDDRIESLYTVAWAYDTYDASIGRNPYKLVTGGKGGHIYVLDFEMKLVQSNIQRLRGFGGDINEIRTCPTNSNIVATACADESIRIHHIRNEGPLITCGGPRTHMGAILTLDWHSSGDYLVAAGFDHQILKWDLSKDPAKCWLKKACEELTKGKRNVLFQTENDEGMNLPIVESMEKIVTSAVTSDIPANNFLEIYNPAAICSDLHSDYVDCIRMLPGSDLFASKATGNDPHIYISKFGLPKAINEFKGRLPFSEPELAQTNYRWMKNPSGSAWFIKFAIDPLRHWIVCGGASGEVFFYDMRERDEVRQHDHVSKIHPSLVGVRHLDFSPCGRLLVGCTDDGIIFRVDRISSDIEQAKFSTFRSRWQYP